MKASEICEIPWKSMEANGIHEHPYKLKKKFAGSAENRMKHMVAPWLSMKTSMNINEHQREAYEHR